MIHAAILLGCLFVGWGLSALVMGLVHRFPAWGDRRALHQLALWSPLLALVLAGGWSVQMALTGCLMFTTADGIGTVGLVIVVAALLLVATVRESHRILATRRRLLALAAPLPDSSALPAEALARRLGIKPPRVCVLSLDQPLAAVAGVTRPVLFVSSWMLEHLSAEELETLAAHELAHLKHADNLIAWLDVILLRAFAFLPPLRRAWQASLAEREEAADARAAAVTRRPLELASALIKVAEHAPLPAGIPTFSGEPRLLERRIERLLAPAPAGRPWGWPSVGAALVAGALPFLTAWVLGYATSCLHH